MSKRSCKICHMGESRGNRLCHPCRCSGSIKYIHKECLLSWMSCSKTGKCDICHYQYKFKDVYKPDTPRILPLSILIKGVVDVGYKAFIVMVWYFLQIAKWGGVFYVNGISFLLAADLFSREMLFTVGHIFVCVVVGVPLTWLAQMHRCLFGQIEKKFGEESRGRRVVVDSRTVLETMARNEEAGTGVDEVQPHGENENDGDVSSESGMSVSGGEDESVIVNRMDERMAGEPLDAFSFKSIVLGVVNLVVPVAFLPGVYVASKRIPAWIPHLSFDMFLEQVDLRYIYSRLIAFGIVFWIMTQGVFYVQKRSDSKRLRFVYIFLKIYYIILLNVFTMYLTFGLIVHYMFGNILNGGRYVLDLKGGYNGFVRGLVSLMFHVSLGYTFSMMVRNVCLKFKRCFRPGLLHFIPDDEDSKMDELYEASKMRTVEIIARLFTYLLVFCMFYGMGFVAVGYLCNGMEVVLSVKSLFKLSLICKVFSMLLYSNDMLGDYVIRGLNKIVRLQSRLLRMENFLYNAQMEGHDGGRLTWCVNKNKVFRKQHIRAREKKKPSVKEISKHFNTCSSSDFAIFYIPRMFTLRCLVMLASVVVFCYCFYAGYVCIAKFVSSKMGLGEYFRGSNDVIFYMVLAGAMRVSWIVVHMVENVTRGRSAVKVVVDLLKYGMVNVYVNVLYPFFGSFVLIMLSDDMLSFNSLRPLRLFVLFFSNTFFVETVVCGYILRSSPEHYSFRMLIGELYKINAFISVLFGVWYLYNAVTLVLGLSNVEFIIVGLLVGYAVLVTRRVNQRIGGDRSFYGRLLDENYLVERRILNVDEE